MTAGTKKSETITLTAADGHKFEAYRATPAGTPRGAIVVIMEIFGVNSHIRGLCDGFAADGYVAIAPAIYDRIQRNVELGYSPEDVAKGRELRGKMNWDHVVTDVQTSVDAVKSAGRVGIVGYCYGGGVTWAAAAKVAGLSASVGYYGGPWADLAEWKPQCPVQIHVAAKDNLIPMSVSEKMKVLHPTLAVHVYDADHGFSCEQRVVYDPYAHELARARTMAFFRATLG